MAQVTATVYGHGVDVAVTAETALEVNRVLDDPEFQALMRRFSEPETPPEATGATESDEEVLPEGEALEVLKEALGASESPTEAVAEVVARADEAYTNAKAAFLAKFGKDK